MTEPMTGKTVPRLVSVDPAAMLRKEGFTLGDWRVEPLRNRVVHEQDGARSLDPRSIDVLVALAARPGEVVTRDELLAEVWRGTFVSENSVSQAMSRLRRALGDDPGRPRYIETIARSGYRTLAEVRWSETPRPHSVEAPLHSIPSGSKRFRLPALAAVAVPAVLAIAFVATRPVDVGSSGGPAPLQVRPELTLVGSTFEPRISPDGAYVAFAWQGPEQDGNFDIWVQPLGGDGPVRLTDDPGPERLPSWSPDSREIAFARFDIAAGQLGVYRIPLIGGTAERVADLPLSTRSLDWSPDGATLLLSGEREVAALDIDSAQLRSLTTPEENVSHDAARFSPDGTRVAFVRKHGPHRHDVMLLPSDGGLAEALTSDAWGQIRGVSWSAGGEAVLFASNRAGRFSLWSVAVDGGSPRRIPIADPWVTQPDVARGGGPMIYRSFRDSIDLWELPAGGAAEEPVQRLSTSRSERQPVWSPDGARIAFVSDRGGSQEIWSGNVDGSDLMRHTDFAGPVPSSPAWSPDGKSLVFDVPVEGHTDVWIVDVDSRRPSRLIGDPSEDRNASFSRDGRSIYFASDRSGEWEIWRAPAGGGEPRVVTEGGGFAAVESFDGAELYFSRVSEPGIWRMPVAGGAAERVVGDLALYDWGSWALAGRGIYYLRRSPTRIEYLPFDTLEPRVVHETGKQMPWLGRALSYSAERDALLFSLIDHSDDEVMTAR